MPRETINVVRKGLVQSRVHVGWDNYSNDVQLGVELPRVSGEFASFWTENLTEQELTAIIKQLKRVRRKKFPETSKS